MYRPAVTPRARQFKSRAPVSFEHAFVLAMKSGHVGIFNVEDGAIVELQGSSIPQMVGNDEYKEQIAQKAMDKFEERMNHEVMRLLGGI